MFASVTYVCFETRIEQALEQRLNEYIQRQPYNMDCAFFDLKEAVYEFGKDGYFLSAAKPFCEAMMAFNVTGWTEQVHIY